MMDVSTSALTAISGPLWWLGVVSHALSDVIVCFGMKQKTRRQNELAKITSTVLAASSLLFSLRTCFLFFSCFHTQSLSPRFFFSPHHQSLFSPVRWWSKRECSVGGRSANLDLTLLRFRLRLLHPPVNPCIKSWIWWEANLTLTLEQSFSPHFYNPGLFPGVRNGYHSDGLFQVALKIRGWKTQKWMIDGAMGLFGSRVHVWAEGVEWCPGYRRGIFPSLSSSLLSCGGGGSAGICRNTRVPTVHLRLALTSADFPSPLVFLQGWRSYLGYVRMSEHTFWSKNVQTRRWIINQQLLILGKQSSSSDLSVCTDRQFSLHREKKNLFFFSLPKFMSQRHKLCLWKPLHPLSCCIWAKKYWAFLNRTAELSLQYSHGQFVFLITRQAALKVFFFFQVIQT